MSNKAVLRTNVLADESETFDVLLSDDDENSLEVNCESAHRAQALLEALSLNGFTIQTPFINRA